MGCSAPRVLVDSCLSRIAHGNDRARDETKLVADDRYGFHPAVGAGGDQVPPSVVVVKTQHVGLTVYFKSQFVLRSGELR